MPPPVNTRTLSNYLSSLSATPSEDVTLVTQNLQVWSTDNLVSPSDLAPVAFSGLYSDLTGLPTLGTASAQDVSYFALAASGALADTALQPSDVGTMAYEDVGDFATYAQGQRADTAIQSVVAGSNIIIDDSDPINPVISVSPLAGGVTEIQAGDGIDVDATVPTEPIVSLNSASQASLALADSAVQPGDLATVATTGAYNDLSGKPTLGALAAKSQISVPGDISATGTPSNTTYLRGDGTWFTPAGGGGGGGQVNSVVEGTGIDVNSVDPANPVVSIQAGYLATVATTGAYSDLSGLPTLGTLAALNSINNGNWSGTDLSIANGGTGASDAATALTNLGAQPVDAELTSWAGVTRATGFDAFAATPSSANLAALLTDETGTGANVFATSPTLVTPNLGTPSAANLTNATALPLTTGVTGVLPIANGGTNASNASTALSNLGGQPLDADLTSWAGVTRASGFDTFAATPSSANLAALVTGETGSGALVFATSPTLVTPVLGAASATSLTLTTDLAVADGGTGASTASAARTNLGLVIGTDVQAYSTQLGQIAALVQAGNAGKVIAVNGAGNGYELITAGGGSVIQSIQTGFVTGATSTGSGEDTAYFDVTISSVTTSKCFCAFYGSLGQSGGTAGSYYSGSGIVHIGKPRVTSSTNLRIAFSGTGGSGANGRWVVVEYV